MCYFWISNFWISNCHLNCLKPKEWLFFILCEIHWTQPVKALIWPALKTSMTLNNSSLNKGSNKMLRAHHKEWCWQTQWAQWLMYSGMFVIKESLLFLCEETRLFFDYAMTLHCALPFTISSGPVQMPNVTFQCKVIYNPDCVFCSLSLYVNLVFFR